MNGGWGLHFGDCDVIGAIRFCRKTKEERGNEGKNKQHDLRLNGQLETKLKYNRMQAPILSLFKERWE